MLREGPIFAQIILADEVNRASPKTQSALLEAMQEYQVTLEGETLKLPEPFIVIATQNPIEFEGTFPLPEAQLDRFLIKLSLGYPSKDEEMEILRRRRERKSDAFSLNAVTDAAGLLAMRLAVEEVYVDADIEALHRRPDRRDTRSPPGRRRRQPPRLAGPAEAGALLGGDGRPRVRPARRREAIRPSGASPSLDRAA